MLKKLKRIFIIGFGLSMVLVGSLTINSELTLAQDVLQTPPDSDNQVDTVDDTSGIVNAYDQTLVNFASLISIVLSFLNYLIWPVLVMIGALMDNDLITGAGMEERLLVVWSQVRNFINLGFAFGLVGIAIYNVFGFDVDGNYAIKKVLPRFILGLVLVNFSFLGCKLVLDAANVVTQAVFAIPSAVQAEFDNNSTDNLAMEICKTVKAVDTTSLANDQTRQADFGQLAQSLCSDKSTFTPFAKDFFQSFSHNNMALVMAVQFGRITSLLDTSDFVRTSPSLINLVVNTLFSVTLYVVYATAYIALLMVLMARVVILWMVIALSPLLALKLALPEGIDIDGLGTIQEQFTKHLIAPIKIGFGMAVGFIMLTALEQVGPTAINASFANQFLAPFPGVSTIQELIIMIATVALTWTIVVDAANDTAASNFVDTLTGFVRNRGEELAKIPLFAPLAPTISSSQPSFSIANAVNAISFNARDLFKQNIQTPPSAMTTNQILQNVNNLTPLSKEDARTTLRNFLANDSLKRSTQITLGQIDNLLEKAELGAEPLKKFRGVVAGNPNTKDLKNTLDQLNSRASDTMRMAFDHIATGLESLNTTVQSPPNTNQQNSTPATQ